MLKWIRTVLVVLIVLVVGLSCSGLAYRVWRQNRRERLLAITSPDGIDEAMFIPVGGAEQWITIRGRDRANPVILVVHGGPGAANAPFAPLFLPYEKDYTLVQWDQPGAGKTFGRAGDQIASGLRIENVAAQGVEVAEYIERHLNKPKVILLGWSWGSIIGIEMARARPDLFVAYVGTGQASTCKRAKEKLIGESLQRRVQRPTNRRSKNSRRLARRPTTRKANSGFSASGLAVGRRAHRLTGDPESGPAAALFSERHLELCRGRYRQSGSFHR